MHQMFAAHFARYPLMTPCDAVKLAYQSTYGGGHLVTNPMDVLARLQQETSATSTLPHSSLLEDIGPKFQRLHLSSSQCKALSLDTISFLFQEGAGSDHDPAALDGPLAVLRTLASARQAPFSSAALDTFLTEYEGLGRPAVSHSEAYRTAYRPAYRVMARSLLRFLPLLNAIDGLLSAQAAVTVAIDGMSAAGKTTLGQLLLRRYGCNLIHMDDFFLPPALRTPDRFSIPGGNVHYERFSAQILGGLATGKPFQYDVFDCHEMKYTRQVTLYPNRLTVIEGAYALHPALRGAYDLKAFYPIDPTAQLERIRIRNGDGCMVRFRDRWIPLENAYIDACGVKDCCDVIL